MWFVIVGNGDDWKYGIDRLVGPFGSEQDADTWAFRWLKEHLNIHSVVQASQT